MLTLDSYEESKGEDAEAEVARLEAQLEEARRRAYEKRTGKPAPPRKVQFAESGDWSESWHELAEDRAAQYPEEAPPPPEVLLQPGKLARYASHLVSLTVPSLLESITLVNTDSATVT